MCHCSRTKSILMESIRGCSLDLSKIPLKLIDHSSFTGRSQLIFFSAILRISPENFFFPNNLFVVEIFAVPLIRKMLNFHTHLSLSLKHCENYLRKLHHISSYIETQSVTNCITDMRSSVCVCRPHECRINTEHCWDVHIS